MPYSVSPRRKLKMVGIEAELKLQHADADALRGEKMPELVHEHEHAEHEDKRQKSCQCPNQQTSDLQFYPAGDSQRTLARPSVDRADRCKRRHLSRPMRVHRLLDDLRNRRETPMRPVEKPRHRDFVGRIQHDRQAALGLERAVGQAQTRETRPCRARRNRAGRRAPDRATAAARPSDRDTKTHTESAAACR